jgi:DNA (cytosine-5)-methyltransferase 1
MLKVLELFGGIGAPRKALENINIDFEVLDYVEIDKYAVMSYNSMYNESYDTSDISDWDKDIEVDLIFHGSPCQDFSLAGNQKGGEKNSGTRSSLLWETVRIVNKLKPKYVIWENVRNLVGKKHKSVFDKYLKSLDKLGYTNHYKILNSKNYGVPQNRERIFCVSILNEQSFSFPDGTELDIILKDLLEDSVPSSFYLSNKQINQLIKNKNWNVNPSGKGMNGKIHIGDIAPTLTTNKGEGPKIAIHDKVVKLNNPSNLSEDSKKQPFIRVKNATKKGFVEAYPGDGIDLNYPNSKTRRGRVQKQRSNTITTSGNLGVLLDNYTIRRLTPKECWRLQGFDDDSFIKAEVVCSNSQLYKQAGNSITVNVLESIFTELFKDTDFM